ncbi:hypothetical protein FRC06_005164 [Ceratobasidium sp. 370]|nr:hypothetical protein FRC06_005164 [Ceratobasidium sp. 370]
MSTNIACEEEKNPDVTISGYRFTLPQTQTGEAENSKTSGGRDNVVDKESPPVVNQPHPDFRRPAPAYERMAADKPGEELAQDAAIWKSYLEEADEHDQELVKTRHSSLDMLLLFAALFSAILTAFLIESKDLLQQDPADATVALLLLIAQSQHRIELGIPPLSGEDGPPSIPGFTPTLLARWINGIWFTSLGLSLSAALVAMLGKEWLNAFLASRPRAPHSHALLRQARLEGLEGWWALHIIALLPSLLHASLLLFAIGLVMYLWTLDTVIAAVLIAIMGTTSLFYVVTAVLGAVYEFCPFVTQISGYLRGATIALSRRRRVEQETTSKYPTLNDLQALLWLTNNARDPTIIDCSYEAMAGLHFTPDASQGNTGLASPHGDSPDDQFYNIPLQLNRDTTTASLIATVTARFKRLITGSLILAGSAEVSAARYLNAILALAAHIRHSYHAEMNSNHPDRHILGSSNTITQTRSTVDPETGLPISAFELLNMSESLWGTESPNFNADACASHLSIGMEIIQLATLTLPSHAVILPDAGRTADQTVPPEPESTGNQESHIVDINPSNVAPNQETQLFGLRACYSRWLAHVSVLLHLHSQGHVTVETRSLNCLLGALRTAAQCNILNPLDSVSTHHLQNSRTSRHGYKFTIPLSKTSTYDIQWNNLRTGPLGVLIDILHHRPSVKEGTSAVQTARAAVMAYSAFAPVLLQQVLAHQRQELLDAFNLEAWPYAPTSDMCGIRYIVVRQILLTIRYISLSRTIDNSHILFLGDLLRALGFCLSQDGGSNFSEGSYAALAHYNSDLIPLIEFFGASDSNFELLNPLVAFNLLNIAQLWITRQHVTPCDNLFTPSCFPPLIHMIESVDPFPSRGVREMLQAMVRRMRTSESSPRDGSIPWNQIPALQYLHCFTRGGVAFAALARVGSRKKFKKAVVTAAAEIVHLAAGRDPALAVESVELDTAAVPGFLDVVLVVAKRCRGVKRRDETLLQFSSDAFELVKAALKDPLSRDILGEHLAPQYLWDALHAVGKDSSSAQQLIEQLRGAGEQLGIVFTDSDENAGETDAERNGAEPREGEESDDEDDSSDEDAPRPVDPPDHSLASLLQQLQQLRRQLGGSSD